MCLMCAGVGVGMLPRVLCICPSLCAQEPCRCWFFGAHPDNARFVPCLTKITRSTWVRQIVHVPASRVLFRESVYFPWVVTSIW